MEEAHVFKLPIALGTQTIRLDEDSLDYQWRGALENFQGMLAYENLRVKTRVTRKNKASGSAAIIAGGLAVVLIPSRMVSHLNFLVPPLAVFLLNLTGYLIFQQLRSDTICVQIEPPPFGFTNELAIPNTEKGRVFLQELEARWESSLRRRFLVRDGIDAFSRLQRINWLEFIGVLTDVEADAERSAVGNEDSHPPKLIESYAVN